MRNRLLIAATSLLFACTIASQDTKIRIEDSGRLINHVEVGQAEPWIVKSSDPSSQVNMISRSDTNDTKEVSPVGYFQPSANRSRPFVYLNGSDGGGVLVHPTDMSGEETVGHILKCMVILTIIFLAIFSNLLVVVSVFRYHKLQQINNYFLVSLAVADLLVACFAMTFNATVEITGKWNFGYSICDLWNSLDVHFSTVSTLHLCCIAVDRYFAIVRPLKYSSYMTVKVAACMIGAAWTAPTLISFLPIFLGWYTTQEHQDWRLSEDGLEKCIFQVNQPYAFISSTLTFWAPVSVMLILYRRIYNEALRQKEALRRSSVVPSTQHLIVENNSSVEKQPSTKNGVGLKERFSLKSKRKSAASTLTSTSDQVKPTQNLIAMTSSPGAAASNDNVINYNSDVIINGHKNPMERSGGNENNAAGEKSKNTGCHGQLLSEPPAATASISPLVPSLTVTDCASSQGDLGSERNVLEDSRPEADQKKDERASLLSLHQQHGSSHQLSPSSGEPGLNTLHRRRLSMAASISEGLRERHRMHTSWRKEHKAFVTLGIVMGAFLLCWLPFFTWYLTVTICGEDRCPCPDIVVSILFWIGYFNSTLNPVIYVMTNRDFKDAFTDILRKIFCWCCPSSRSSRQPGLMIDRQHLHDNRGSYGGGVSSHSANGYQSTDYV